MKGYGKVPSEMTQAQSNVNEMVLGYSSVKQYRGRKVSSREKTRLTDTAIQRRYF